MLKAYIEYIANYFTTKFIKIITRRIYLKMRQTFPCLHIEFKKKKANFSSVKKHHNNHGFLLASIAFESVRFRIFLSMPTVFTSTLLLIR